MDIAAMLKPANIRCEASAGSKKHALDLLSEVLAGAVAGPTAAEVLEGLTSRERLGPTGLGRAVAMPHARVPGIEAGAAALLKLDEPVDFDSPDGEPVDLLFGVLLPDDTDDGADLGELARRLADPELLAQLRSADDPAVLRELLVKRLRVDTVVTGHS